MIVKDDPPIPVQVYITSFENQEETDYSQFSYGVDPKVFEIPTNCKWSPRQ